MPAPVRTPGKRGKLRAEPLGLKFIHQYATTPLAAPVYPVDVSHGIAPDAWGMLANGPDPTCTVAPDGVGDCTFAGRQHLRMAKAAGYGLTETWETSNQLAGEYLAYDHGKDDGAVISRLLMTWYRAGIILGFAPVNHKSAEAVDAAMQAFGGVYCGVDLTDDADDLFSEGLPWTVADGEQPDPDEGHCIVGVKATAAGRTYVTWGAEQEATADWSAACLTEAWAVITTEDEAAKIDMPALIADIEALHGTVQVHVSGSVVTEEEVLRAAKSWTVTNASRQEEGTAMSEQPAGPLARIEQWTERHIAPDLADIRTAVAGLENRAEQALTCLEARAANAQQLAALLADVVKAVDPADATVAAALLSRAEAIAAEADRIAQELLAKGM